MNVASLELCKELYELSGWIQYFDWHYDEDGQLKKYVEGSVFTGIPAYPLGYLLRKLPKTLDLGKPKVRDLHIVAGGDCWVADYKYRMPSQQQEWMHMYDKAKLTEATTPEDAVAKLCIELFKQGILTKGEPA
jgi:hypothetical protein